MTANAPVAPASPGAVDRRGSEPAPSAPWHTLAVDEVRTILELDLHTGLAPVEAQQRLARFGPNVLAEERRRGPLAMLAGQFADFMILVLIGAAVVSGLIGEVEDTIVILAIVVLNAVIGFVQEYRAEQAVAALRRMAAANATVVRGGERSVVPVSDLVPGDCVLLEAGNIVPADLRVARSARLRAGEAALTGESVPVEKETTALADPGLPLGDRTNMVFKGTLITYGRGAGIVVATGMATELGKIAGLLMQEESGATPLQRRLAAFGKRVAFAVLVLCGLFFVLGLLRGEPAMQIFLTAVSLAVAAIPEALPAVVTLSLAVGAFQMVRRNALVRRLPAVETLGSVTYVCSDKTGTLTENLMQVEVLWADGEERAPGGSDHSPPWLELYRGLALCNDAQATGAGGFVGDPTETALLAAASVAGFGKAMLEQLLPRSGELPFDSERKLMTTVHADGHAFVAFTKGAPECLFPRCCAMATAGGIVPLDRELLAGRTAAMAHDGMRVLGFAVRSWTALPPAMESEVVEADLVFLGLVGMIDPPRAEAAGAVAMCRSAGITPVMITGDHPATALAIARRLAIAEDSDVAVSGIELARMDDGELAACVRRTPVFARVDPQQKIRIVAALQACGEFVAMTGDGVNDAPALKRANIGVAMGKAGTDVAREASDMVLLDDNFATIVAAIRSGRRIYDNIRRFVRYALTTNSGELWTVVAAPFLGLPIPLLPIHILWINLVTDGLPGLALTAEPEERGVMQRPPRAPDESIFVGGMWQHILWVGALMGVICLGLAMYAQRAGIAHWQTMLFTTLTFCQLAHVLAIRSERESLFTLGLLSNPYLIGAVLLTTAMQLAVIYLPPLQQVFKVEALTADELGVCALLAGVVFVAVEIEKWLVRRNLLYRLAPTEAERGRGN